MRAVLLQKCFDAHQFKNMCSEMNKQDINSLSNAFYAQRIGIYNQTADLNAHSVLKGAPFCTLIKWKVVKM